MLSRAVFGAFALASSLLMMASEKKPARNCCTSNAARVSPQQVDALLYKTEPVQAHCGSYGLHIEGTIVLAIAVDANGDVTCVAVVSGHPLIIGSAIDSVRRWKFRSYVVDGLKKDFCGRVAVRYAATDCGLKYEVVQATEN